jgi:hypothetical protein
MNLIEFFNAVVQELKKKELRFAIAGGVIASVYRNTPRATRDLDVVIMSQGDFQKEAESLVSQFGLEPHLLRKADLEGGPMFAIKNQSTPALIVSGVPKEKDRQIGLDFILQSMPWVSQAIDRAQVNMIDFGFGRALPNHRRFDLGQALRRKKPIDTVYGPR